MTNREIKQCRTKVNKLKEKTDNSWNIMQFCDHVCWASVSNWLPKYLICCIYLYRNYYCLIFVTLTLHEIFWCINSAYLCLKQKFYKFFWKPHFFNLVIITNLKYYSLYLVMFGITANCDQNHVTTNLQPSI